MNKFVFILWSIFPRNLTIANLHAKDKIYYFVWLGKYFVYEV